MDTTFNYKHLTNSYFDRSSRCEDMRDVFAIC